MPHTNAAKPAELKTAIAASIALARAKVGQQVALLRIEGGRAFQHRLAEMGLTPGIHFTILSKGRPGPMIVAVKDTRLVLGQGMMDKVLVRPV